LYEKAVAVCAAAAAEHENTFAWPGWTVYVIIPGGMKQVAQSDMPQHWQVVDLLALLRAAALLGVLGVRGRRAVAFVVIEFFPPF
jgi:hypothetical protein